MNDAITATKTERAGSHLRDTSQFLTFTLQDEEYGIEILKVQEIKGFSRLTAVPNAPSYVKGVLNLRGTVVPIIDLRRRFSMVEKEHDQFTVIIVVNVGTKVVGLLVDTVSDVLDIPETEIADAPELAGSVDSSFVNGMGKVNDRLVMLLDIARLVGGQDIPCGEEIAV